MNYPDKYFKYKYKYLNLKNIIQAGGAGYQYEKAYKRLEESTIVLVDQYDAIKEFFDQSINTLQNSICKNYTLYCSKKYTFTKGDTMSEDIYWIEPRVDLRIYSNLRNYRMELEKRHYRVARGVQNDDFTGYNTRPLLWRCSLQGKIYKKNSKWHYKFWIRKLGVGRRFVGATKEMVKWLGDEKNLSENKPDYDPKGYIKFDDAIANLEKDIKKCKLMNYYDLRDVAFGPIP